MAFDTTDYSTHRFFPASVEDKLIGAIGRVAGLVLLSIIAFAWLSLVTWTTRDPSLTLATSGPVQNIAGAPGAIVADLLLKMMGFGSVIALFAPMFWGVQLINARQVDGFRSKVAFYPLSVLMFAGALSALPASASWPIEHGYGGILGDFVFGLVAEFFSAINPARAAVATGVLLSGVGLTTVMYSLGLELRDLHRILFQPLRSVKWREKAGSWQNVLLNEANRLRENVRGSLNSEWPDEGGPSPDRDKEAWATSEPQSYTAEADWHPEARRPAARTAASAGLIHPLRPNPLVHPTDDATEDHEIDVAQTFVAAQTGSDIVLPPTTPHPVSNPFDDGQCQDPLHDAAPQGPVSNFVKAGPVPPRQTIAEKFAAHVATDSGEPGGLDFNGDVDDVGPSSRAMAKRFAPVHAAHRADVDTAPREVGAPAPTMQPARPQTGGPVPTLMRGKTSDVVSRRFILPSTKLLARPNRHQALVDHDPHYLRQRADELQTVLADFGVKGAIKNIRPGPVVTLYEFEPARGIKSSRVIALADDLARSMSALSARVAVVPGRNAIGIELPNAERQPVVLRELLDSNAYRGSGAALPLALGKSIGGEAVVADLARMPHLLVAGTTGSGKSVGVNAMVLSILLKHAPDTCRLLMIDPKMLELSVYNDIPHLLAPVITDPQKAVSALNWAVREMEERYKRMSQLSVRNIGVYNNRIRNAKKRGESLSRTVHTGFDASGQAVYENQDLEREELPHIVIVVDEFADLMLVAGKEIEAAIQRLAQMARAAGIHLIMATQRPSVDVITGTIKANFPTRISFKVTSKVDSRTILNEQGAEQLLGQGDMLYASGSGQTVRVHGPFVSDEEVESIAGHLKGQAAPAYVAEVTAVPASESEGQADKPSNGEELYDQAVAIVLRDRKASTSYVQRRLSIGYNRAADLIERMEHEGIIGPAGSGGKREILVSHPH